MKKTKHTEAFRVTVLLYPDELNKLEQVASVRSWTKSQALRKIIEAYPLKKDTDK